MRPFLFPSTQKTQDFLETISVEEIKASAQMDDVLQNTEQADHRFQKFAKVFSEITEQNQELKAIIDTLNEGLESSRSTHDFLKKEILGKLSAESQTVQYAKLLSNIQDLENQIGLYKEKEVKLQIEFQEERQRLLNDLQNEKNAHRNTEQRLANDLQVANNLAAIQYDELETKMQERLGAAMVQLKEAKNTCNVLRAEVFSLKQRLANNNSEEKIRRLEEKLRFTEEQLKNSQRTLHEQNTSASVAESASNLPPCKYSPLNAVKFDNRAPCISPTFKMNGSFNQCHVTDKQARNIQRPGNVAGFPIPPLKPLGQGTVKSVPKKRKLFDPDNLAYLDCGDK